MLEKEGVIWQPQVERRWLANLLGDEKAAALLLRFLKTTGIGRREGARERELKSERKTTKKMKDCLAQLRRGKPQKLQQVVAGSKNGGIVIAMG